MVQSMHFTNLPPKSSVNVMSYKKTGVVDPQRWVAQSVSGTVTHTLVLTCLQEGCMPDVCNMTVVILSAAPISGPFDALIDDGITFNASIKNQNSGC